MPAYSTSSTDQGWLLYGGRLFAAAPATVVAQPKPDDEDPWEVKVEMRLDIQDGRLVCTKLSAEQLPDGPPVTLDNIRRIPVARIVAAAADEFGLITERKPGGGYSLMSTGFDWPADDFAKNGPTPDALEDITRVYAFCMASGLSPNAELLKRYGIPKPTTSRWISTARRRGILVDEHRRIGE
ncbi:hypothetical protein [Nocardia sp. CY41]|uniref:hypothetical protein n=1 Tax=Nocardia sp. CY41 TaxID=2608686 RepID=UPI00135AD5AC|nr:hypothetical protein [Nocardia sp. CY41]